MPDPNRAFSPSLYWMGHYATLVSIFAIFATLGVGYLWRSSNPIQWQPIHLPAQLTLSTVLLLGASASIEMARFVLRRRGFLQAYTSWLIRTAVFATAFVITQALCWRSMLNQAVQNNTNEQFFYVLTGAHAAHIVGGMVALAYLLWRIWNPWGGCCRTPPQHHHRHARRLLALHGRHLAGTLSAAARQIRVTCQTRSS